MSKFMMKSQPFKEDKVVYPCYITPKMDGVPAIITKDSCKSRGGEDILSIQHIIDELKPFFEKHPSVTLIGELYIRGKPFKDISGMVRDTKQQHPELPFYTFDYYDKRQPKESMDSRMKKLYFLVTYSFKIRITYWRIAKYINQIYTYYIDELSNGYEGAMIRNFEAPYEPNKKSWGSMKLKPYLHHDLRCVGFEESHTKDRTPKGIIGSLLVEYKGAIAKAGAGKLNHMERKKIWENQEKYIGKLVEIKCLKDTSYKLMREPTFQRWRDDKDEVSYED